MKQKRKVLIQDEIIELRKNPYTSHVTEYHICYTEKFREEFWRRLQTGKTPRMVFIELGYSPEILGPKRIERYAYRIRRTMGGEEPLPKTNRPAKRSCGDTNYSSLPQNKAISAMQHELTYLRQEVEFLKKLSVLENEKKRRG